MQKGPQEELTKELRQEPQEAHQAARQGIL